MQARPVSTLQVQVSGVCTPGVCVCCVVWLCLCVHLSVCVCEGVSVSDPSFAGSSCPFEGTREELVVHLENCRYEGLKEYLQRTDEHMVVMQEELRKKDEEIEFLRSMLARLSEKLETLDKTTSLRLGEGGVWWGLSRGNTCEVTGIHLRLAHVILCHDS